MAENSVVGVIKEVGIIITPIVLAWIAYKQIGLSKKQDRQNEKVDQLKEQTDGKMNELLEASNSAKLAEWKLAGLAAVDAKELVKAVEIINGGHKDEPTEVKIVDQSKPVEVKTKKEE